MIDFDWLITMIGPCGRLIPKIQCPIIHKRRKTLFEKGPYPFQKLLRLLFPLCSSLVMLLQQLRSSNLLAFFKCKQLHVQVHRLYIYITHSFIAGVN
jgi:hypothetical protein